jgi:hypothetical protein
MELDGPLRHFQVKRAFWIIQYQISQLLLIGLSEVG